MPDEQYKRYVLYFLALTGTPQPVVQRFYSPTAVKVTWGLLPDSQGIVTGYKLHLKEIPLTSEPTNDPFEVFGQIENASQTSLVIQNLSIFTTYQIRMASYSSKGVGHYSDPVTAGKQNLSL